MAYMKDVRMVVLSNADGALKLSPMDSDVVFFIPGTVLFVTFSQQPPQKEGGK